jgi:hypothetical protein
MVVATHACIQRAGAVLLGRDMRRMARHATYTHLVGKLRLETSSSSSCPLAQEIRNKVTHGDFLRARLLLKALLAGMES